MIIFHSQRGLWIRRATVYKGLDFLKTAKLTGKNCKIVESIRGTLHVVKVFTPEPLYITPEEVILFLNVGFKTQNHVCLYYESILSY